MDFMANVLEASTEYSIVGKDLDGKILLWNNDTGGDANSIARRRRSHREL